MGFGIGNFNLEKLFGCLDFALVLLCSLFVSFSSFIKTLILHSGIYGHFSNEVLDNDSSRTSLSRFEHCFILGKSAIVIFTIESMSICSLRI